MEGVRKGTGECNIQIPVAQEEERSGAGMEEETQEVNDEGWEEDQESKGYEHIFLWGTYIGEEEWDSLIINNTEGLLLHWPKDLEDLRMKVERGRKKVGSTFWYANWGIDNIVATKRGSRAHRLMDNVKALLYQRVRGLEYWPEGNFRVLKGMEMETQWEQEMVNLAAVRGHSEYNITRMRITDEHELKEHRKRGRRYTVVIHMDKGIVEYPDVIEWRRREEEEERSNGDEWEFTRWDDWIIASKRKREDGMWRICESLIEKMRKEKIGPDSDDYGEGRIMSREEGRRIMERIMENGDLAMNPVEDVKVWSLNERVKLTGTGEKSD